MPKPIAHQSREPAGVPREYTNVAALWTAPSPLNKGPTIRSGIVEGTFGRRIARASAERD